MPITWPAPLASAPPESPSAIGALVCSMLCSVSVFEPLPESLAVMVLSRAVITPLVTVGEPSPPPALPMATTPVPRVTLDESPTWTVFSPDAPWSLISATSSVGSTPSTVAVYFFPPTTVFAVRCVDPLTTWLLVSTIPLEDRIMPVPAAAPSSYLSVELMSTTPGWTLSATDCTSMLVVLALPAPFAVRRRDLLRGDGLAGGLGVVVQRDDGARPDSGGQRRDHHVDQRPAAATAVRGFLLGAVADDVVRAPAARGSTWWRAPGTVAAGLAVAAAGLAVAAGLAALGWLAVPAGRRSLAERGGRLVVTRLAVCRGWP